MDSEKVATKFMTDLKGLNCNSKPIITALTRLADEYIRYAPVVVECIENHLQQVRLELKLAVLYLIDSIVKNIRRDYVNLFSNNIVSTFTKTFEQLAKYDQVSKVKMMKLRNTWKDVFPDSKLYNIDCICKMTDPGWSVQPSAPSNKNIHVNRKFLMKALTKGPSSSTPYGETSSSLPFHSSISSASLNPNRLSHPTVGVNVKPPDGVIELREELLVKQKKLLELQTQKLKLEVLQAQAQLEEKTRERIEFDSSYLNQVLLQQAETARQKTQIATSLLSSAVNVPTLANPNPTPAVTTAALPYPEAVPPLRTALSKTSEIHAPLSKHIILPELSHIRKSPKVEADSDAQIKIDARPGAEVVTLFSTSKPYYKGYDPSNVYDKASNSGSVNIVPKLHQRVTSPNSRSPMQVKSDLNLVSDDMDEVTDGDDTSLAERKLSLAISMDMEMEALNHVPIKTIEAACEIKTSLKRSSDTLTAPNSESNSNQCPVQLAKILALKKTDLTVPGSLNVNSGDSSVSAITIASEYPPLKKPRKTHESEEDFSPINDLFGGEDVDLRPSSSSASSLGSGNAIIGAQPLALPQIIQKKVLKESPSPLNANHLKGLVQVDMVESCPLPRPTVSPSNLMQDSDHRLLGSVNPKLKISNEFPSSTHQHNGPSTLIPLQDDVRSNPRWNQNQNNYPLVSSTAICGSGVRSSNYMNGMPGMGINAALGSSLVSNPWIEGSKAATVWNSVAPVDSPFIQNNGFAGPGWHSNSLAPCTPSIWLPQPVGPNPFEEALAQPQPQGFSDHIIVPAVNMAEYESISEDTCGTVPIDGVLRKVRFYGETAVVFQGINGDEPREISFRANEPRNVYIDKEREPIRCYFGKSSSFFLNRKKHSLKLGAPTREIYFDGNHYEASFGGDPILIRSGDGVMHRLKLEGPPPKVHVGKLLRYDLVAGRLNLFVDGHRLDIYLDDKPQLFELPCDDYPLILRFCDGFHTITMNGFPVPTHFGGPPVTITVPGGKRHQIGLSALNDSTTNAMIRYLKYHSQELNNPNQATKVSHSYMPMPQTEMGSIQRIRDTGTGRDKDLSTIILNPIRSDANDGASDSNNFNEEVTSTSDSVSTIADDDNNDSHINTASATSTSKVLASTPATNFSTFCDSSSRGSDRTDSEEAQTTTVTPEPVSFSGSVNVHDLLLKLKVAGLLPATVLDVSPGKQAGEPETDTEPKRANQSSENKSVKLTLAKDKDGAAKNCKRQKGLRKKLDSKKESQIAVAPPPPLETVDLDFSQLKQRVPAVVAQIWTGTQCSSCGFRFPPDQSQKFSEHLDWHFRNNRKMKVKGKKINRRQFYYQLSDWMQYSEFEEREDRARSMFEVQAAEKLALLDNKGGSGDVSVSWMNSDLHTVPCAGHEEDICPQCGEGFETYFDEEKEEWRFKGACISYDEEGDNQTRRAFHILCYKDLLASLEGKSVLSYVNSSNEDDQSKVNVEVPSTTHKKDGNDNDNDNEDDIIILKEGKREVEVMDIVDFDDEQPGVPSSSTSMETCDKAQELDAVVDDQAPVSGSTSTSTLPTVADMDTTTDTKYIALSNETDATAALSSSGLSPEHYRLVDLDGDIHSDSTESIHSEESPFQAAELPHIVSVTDDSNSTLDVHPVLTATATDNAVFDVGKSESPVVEASAVATIAETTDNEKIPIDASVSAGANESITVDDGEKSEAADISVCCAGDISVVKIDLTEDDDDVMEVSPPASVSSSTYAISTIEGNIPLNGHTPLINKVSTSSSIRIRIEDARLNDEKQKSHPLKVLSADTLPSDVSIKEDSTEVKCEAHMDQRSSNIITVATTLKERDNEKTSHGGPVASSSNNNKSVSKNTCTKTVTGDNIDVIEECVIINEPSDENSSSTPDSNLKPKSLPLTKFTDCPPRLAGKETSGLCVIS